MAEHDQHFLERLERLERDHLELALGLYYDHQLVQLILGAERIPDDVERVALCLGEPSVGPHVIVTRDGHFVTCLGKGMQLRDSQAVISRRRLNKISEDVEALRGLVADSAAGKGGRSRSRLARVFEAGPYLTLEEFDDVARWLPLMEMRFLLSHMDTVTDCLDLVDQLARVKKWNRRNDELLYGYWQLSWAIAHLTMLLGSDDERLRGLVERIESEIPNTSTQLTWSLMRLGTTSFGMRGVWVASKMPTFIVPVAKRRYLDPEATVLSSMTDGLGMMAAALRHRRYQGEVRKVIQCGTSDGEASSAAEAVRNLCAAYFELLVDDPQLCLDHVRTQARKLLTENVKDSPDHARAMAELPDEIAIAIFSLVPLPLAEPAAVSILTQWLSWIVTADARAFYLPRDFAGIVTQPWKRHDGLALLEPRLRMGVARQKPYVAGLKIGRNAPCPCGSGNKYKRCCGAAGMAP